MPTSKRLAGIWSSSMKRTGFGTYISLRAASRNRSRAPWTRIQRSCLTATPLQNSCLSSYGSSALSTSMCLAILRAFACSLRAPMRTHTFAA